MKNFLHLKTNLVIGGALLFFSLQAQHFDSVLSRLNNNYPQEKIYVQFDRSIYNAGETIWFKAYLFSGVDLSVISNTMYAELVDDKGNIIQRVTAPVSASSAAGSFEIPQNVVGDRIYVRAYTKWMLNFDSSFLYLKSLPLITKAGNNAKASTTYVQFFPEGGDLVEGVLSRVAFKATDEHGIPVNVKGDITGAAGKMITGFTSIHDGMGVFTLTPATLEKYRAVWKDDQGQLHETILPVPKKEGVVLEVNNAGSQINFTVKRSQDSSPSSEIIIVAQFQQQLIYRANATVVRGGQINALIPVDSLPAGILQITVFDKAERPLAERLVFINQRDYYFNTGLDLSVTNTLKREKNVIEINVPDTISYNLSIAVTDADLNAPAKNQDNIFSHVLMTSDLKGYVHNPGYYFSGEADSIVKHLDLVMMTNGWRRFEWKEVLADHWPVLKYMPEDYVAIEGKVSHIKSKLIRGREIMGILQVKNRADEWLTTEIRKDGSFLFQSPIFYDTARVFYQFNNDKGKALTSRGSFSIKNSFLNLPMSLQLQEVSKYGYTSKDSVTVKNKQFIEKYLSQSSPKTKVLKTVVINSKQKSRKQIMDEEYTSGLFSDDGIVVITEDDPSAASQTVLGYLRGKVAGLHISDGGVSMAGSPTSFFINESPAGIDLMNSMNMSDVAMIKVLRPPFAGVVGGGPGGAISVYIKKGGERNDVRGLSYLMVMGYTPVKQFYSPAYPANASNTEADLRKTLYWNPFVIPDKRSRHISLSFFNNDVTKRFRVIIEGCNEMGQLTRIEKVFE